MVEQFLEDLRWIKPSLEVVEEELGAGLTLVAVAAEGGFQKSDRSHRMCCWHRWPILVSAS